MSKVVISGYYGFSNAGDEAILMALVRALKQMLPGIGITVLSADPEATSRAYGVNAVDRGSVRDVVKAIKGCDCFISGGGSLIQDVTSKKSLLYYLALISLARRFGKKVVIYANGIGPLNWAVGRMLTRKVLSRADILSVRDEDSRALLKEIGVSEKLITLAADPVFSLPKPDPEHGRRILESCGADSGRPLVCFNTRPWRSMRDINRVLAEAADFAAAEFKAQAAVIAMNPDDDKTAREFAGFVKSGAVVITGRYAPDDLMSVISNARVLVGVRLHSLIFAAVAGVPFLGIPYDPKVQSLLKMFDMPGIGDIKAAEPSDVLIHLSRLWHDRESLGESIARRTSALARLVDELNRDVAGIIISAQRAWR